MPFIKKALTLVLILLNACLLHAQNIKERVLAEVHYVQQIGSDKVLPYDSIRYSYSGSRHSGFNPNRQFYVSEYPYNYYGESGMYPDFYNLDPTHDYDSSFQEGADFDTALIYKPDINGALKLYHICIRAYNADGTTRRVERFVPKLSDAYGRDSNIRQDISYSSGRISKVYSQVSRTGNWDTIGLRNVSYNFIGQVQMDSSANKNHDGIFIPIRSNSYYYNAAGQYQSQLQIMNMNGTKDTSGRVINKYYPNGDLLSATSESWKAPQGFGNQVVDSYTYTADIPFYTGHYTSRTGGIQRSSEIDHVNAKNQIDSVTIYYVDDGQSLFLTSLRYTYNDAGNPTLLEGFYVDSNTGAGIGTHTFTRWYYQQYKDSVATRYPFITIAPNPTTGTLVFHYPDYKAGEPVSVVIFNMLGQCVHSESFIPKGANTNITLGDAAATGIYGIRLYTNGNAMLYKGTFLKQ